MKTPFQAACWAARQTPVQETALVSYHSKGHLLIIGSAASVLSIETPLLPNKTALLVASCSEEQKRQLAESHFRLLETTQDFTLQGYLGAFYLSLPHHSESLQFDLILDLQDPPLIRLEVTPVGYYAAKANQRKLNGMLAELAEMTGTFDKPKFFDFREHLCAHGGSGFYGCDLCIDACAAGAIISRHGQISVNPYLCQGCGDCGAVCPSGALNYNFPGRKDTLNRLRGMLQAWIRAGGQRPVLVFHENDIGHLNCATERLITYPLESLGSVGMDIWLAALAYGAKQVCLLDHGKLTTATQNTLHEQIKLTRQILLGMGYAQNLICLLDSGSKPPHTAGPIVKPAGFAGDADKRTVIRMAVENLLSNAPVKPTAVTLSKNSPFGQIAVDIHSCTLCMSCVSICPAGALQDGREQPALRFIEAYCVQCALCQTACPEQAITLQPRYLYSNADARKPRLLHEDKIFHCIRCRKPFATESIIKKIGDKLQSHPMFQDEKRRQLEMCEQCRIKSQFEMQ